MAVASIKTTVTRGAAQELPIAVVAVRADGTESAAAGDATAVNQTSQITQETLINTRLGDITTPAAGTVNSRLATLNTTLGSPLQAGGTVVATQSTASSLKAMVSGVDADAATPTVNPQTVAGLYTSGSLGTLSTGQLGRVNVDTYRNLRATFCGLSATAADGFANASLVFAQPDALGTRTLGLFTVSPYIFNGGSHDRLVKPNATSRIISSAATTNATSAKASAGNVHLITGRNTSASVLYLKLYNKASAPTVGTDTPVMTIPLPATSAFPTIEWPNGYYFSTGIAYAITTGSADADTGAVAAGDVIGLNLNYS